MPPVKSSVRRKKDTVLFRAHAPTYGYTFSSDDRILLYMKEKNYGIQAITKEFKARGRIQVDSWVNNRWNRMRSSLRILYTKNGQTFDKGEPLILPSMANNGIKLLIASAQANGNVNKSDDKKADKNSSEGISGDANGSADEDAHESSNETAKEDTKEDADDDMYGDADENINENPDEEMNENASDKGTGSPTANPVDQTMTDAPDTDGGTTSKNGSLTEGDEIIAQGSRHASEVVVTEKEAVAEEHTTEGKQITNEEQDIDITGDEEEEEITPIPSPLPLVPNAPTYDVETEVIICNLPRHFTVHHVAQVFRKISWLHIQPSSSPGVFALLCTNRNVAEHLVRTWVDVQIEGKRINIIPARLTSEFLLSQTPP